MKIREKTEKIARHQHRQELNLLCRLFGAKGSFIISAIGYPLDSVSLTESNWDAS